MPHSLLYERINDGKNIFVFFLILKIVHQVGRDAEIGMFEVLLESIDFKEHS
jgi:hypothetical protein